MWAGGYYYINAQRLLFIMLYMTLIGRQRESFIYQKSLNTQQDITASSSVV